MTTITTSTAGTAGTAAPAAAEFSAAPDRLPLTITAAAAALRDGSLTSTALLRAVTARAERLDAAIGTYIVRTDEAAQAAAARADEELAAGIDRGPLHGIPLGVKDIIATSDAPSTAQSLILDPAFGAQGDAVVVSRLRAAGAVITGKTTTAEYAIGMPDPSKGFPTPRSPYALDHYPGGSSSGTGSGVAAGMFLGGLGTDTGGSVRLPASWCGVTGMKQTFGRVPKSGCVPLGFSYDNIGPLTRSARDAAAMLAVMAGHDGSDPCSADRPVDDYTGALTGSVEGLRIGVDTSLLDRPACDPEVAALTRAALDVLAAAGATVSEIRLPLWDELVTAAMSGFMAEAFAYHRGDLGARWNDYGRPTRGTLALGALVTGPDYVQTQRVRRAGVKAMAELLTAHDLLVTPTCLTPSIPLDELSLATLAPSILTPYWNSLGNPAMSVPMGLTSAGLPVGLQLAGRPFEETTVFRAADAFQSLTGHHLTESPIVKELLA
jgi:aspartyl-tRNA(Asn)/glutamyl-tRNA(Gln) amidotransferase subunit A